MLHGDIQVNGHTIASWTAVNRGADPEMPIEGINVYDVSLAYTNIKGYHMTAEFQVHHRYGAGALRLVENILHRAPEHLRDVRMDDDGYAVRAVAEKVFG